MRHQKSWRAASTAPDSKAVDSTRTQEKHVQFNLECEREDDGRWLAEVGELPGTLAYGSSANEAVAKAEVLALRILAERLEHGESRPIKISGTGYVRSPA